MLLKFVREKMKTTEGSLGTSDIEKIWSLVIDSIMNHHLSPKEFVVYLIKDLMNHDSILIASTAQLC